MFLLYSVYFFFLRLLLIVFLYCWFWAIWLLVLQYSFGRDSCVWSSVAFLSLWVFGVHQLEQFAAITCSDFSSLLPFMDSKYTYVRPPEVVAQLTDAQFIFVVLFCSSLCFILYSLYCYVLNSLVFPSSAVCNLPIIFSSVFFI